jgi:hypothetical protein
VRLVNGYVARVLATAAADPAVAGAFLRVAHGLDRPERLMHPAVAGRVLRAARRKPGVPPGSVPAPRVSPEAAEPRPASSDPAGGAET